MGLEIRVTGPGGGGLATILDRLARSGIPATLAMVDNALCRPGQAPPADWRDARLRTPAGMVALRREPDVIAVTVFGNADTALQAAQQAVASALRGAMSEAGREGP